MKKLKILIKELEGFLILWSTQSLSALGSSVTSFALIIWSYQKQGSALSTALLSVCSYLPYILMSIFAGALSDKWDKKVSMFICDSFAALSTIIIFILLKTESLEVWHLYFLNALNGLMNTVQQPASDVTISLLTPKKHYQKVSGLRSFSNSLVNILTPVIATALLSFFGMNSVIFFDLATFGAAFFSLAFFIKIPKIKSKEKKTEPVFESAKSGLLYLKNNRGILDLILFLAAINLVASVYNAALPAMLLSRNGGGDAALGILNTVTGISMLIGSVLSSVLPEPKSRVRVIFNYLTVSMCSENFLLAFGKSLSIWCVGAVLGWICIPVMNANMDVLLRCRIPISMQGRVFSARNTLQFFTIPLGYFIGGIAVDKVFEPFMAAYPKDGVLSMAFGTGKGSGAAFLFFVIAIAGITVCLVFRKDKNIWMLEKEIDGE